MSNFLEVVKIFKDGEYVGQSGKAAKFGFLLRSPSKNKDTGEYNTMFVDCICFGKQIEPAMQCKKGDYVGIAGSIDLNKYTTREGIERISLQVIADMIKPMAFGEKKQSSDSAPAQQNFAPPAPAPFSMAPDETSLPFDL